LAATFSAARFSANLARGFLAELTSAKSAQGPEPEDVENAAQPDQPNIVEVAGLAMALPARLQSPSTELTRPELERAALVFERSLVFLRKLLPGTLVLIVYVPLSKTVPLATRRSV
jgi:hypothetical protein